MRSIESRTPAAADAGTPRVRRARRSRGIAVGLLAALLVPVAAFAHQRLVGSAPAAGERLDAVPGELRLEFAEPAELTFTRVQLLAADGRSVPLTPARHAPDSPAVVLLGIEGPLAPGEYTVEWRSAGADGHPVSGRYSFAVEEDARGVPPPVAPDAPAGPERDGPPVAAVPAAAVPAGAAPPAFDAGSPAYVAVRWLTFAGLLALIGAVAFRLLVLPATRRTRLPAASAVVAPAAVGAARLGLAAAILLAFALVARLYAQAYALYGPAEATSPALLRAMIAGTGWGTAWLIQAVAVLVAILAFSVARRDRRPAWVLAVGAAVALAATPALSGHAAAAPDFTRTAIVADTLHVLAAGGWIGGLFAVLAVGVPAALRLGGGSSGPAIAAMVNAFSPTALIFGGLVVATGLFSTWMHVGGLAPLLGSDYGRTLLLKIGLLAVLFVIAAYNFLRVRTVLGDEAGTRRLRRSGSLELVIAVVVIVVTAVLVALPTPGDLPGLAE